ncbi:ABC transporter permease [Klebsiella pneumoniae]|uniref:ABC transporter permease n=1 Tax=Klebsiella pneumoniae TaxID=573 RepID=UPI0028475A03|nr:ABC transporter permease subunit [Klebsiella pneumoniae]MDR4825651.1 ABC transporter permease subunit [Klebsiella pneumoniae]
MKQTFLSGATLAALVMLVALPLVFILLQAIFPHFSAGSLGDAFGGIPALLADPQLPAMLGGTLWIAAGVALVSVMIGLPLGILRGMFSLPLPRLWDLLFLIPFLTPPYISALSWMLALQSQGYLQQLTGWQLNDLLFSRSGIVLVMTFNIFPVVYFAVSRSLLASGTRLAVVARVHGASAWRAFWHVTLPMLSPALAAGMLLAFTLAIEEFGVPAALGSRAGVVMLTVGIEKKLADWPVDLPGAALLSLMPAALPGVVVGVGLILLWNQPFWPRSPYNTLWMLLLSYCCLLLPWPVRYVGSALRQLGPNLEPAARVHGASPLQALRLIVLPLVFPALLAAMLMVFAVASRELVTSLLLSPAGTQTVAVFIWRQFEQGSVGQGMAMASLTLLTGLVLMLTALALMQRRTCG